MTKYYRKVVDTNFQNFLIVIVFFIFLSFNFSYAEKVLQDANYHYSFIIPSQWTFQKSDSVNSFLRYKCYNPDSTAIIFVYAIKVKGKIDFNKFVKFIPSEKLLGKGLGAPYSTHELRISGIKSIRNRYKLTLLKKIEVKIDLYMFVKREYGYAIKVIYPSTYKNEVQLEKIVRSFSVALPRSLLSWLFLLGFIGSCIYGGAVSSRRLIEWIGPFNLFVLVGAFAVLLLSIAGLIIIFLLFSKIGIWISLISSAIIIVAANHIPNPSPVKNAFKEAQKKDTAGAYRAFCEKYKHSLRYYKKSKQRMRMLIKDVVDKFKRESYSKEAQLFQAILAMFDYVEKTDNFIVGIYYDSENQIVDLTDIYKKMNLNVLPASSAFSSKKTRAREKFITELIRFAFHTFTPDDILGFKTIKSKTKDQVIINVKYTFRPGRSLYTWVSEKDLSDEKKTFLWE